MSLDRTIQPSIRPLTEFSLQCPVSQRMKNGMPLHIIDVGSAEVVRIDILIGGGQCEQTQLLQAMFTNRMLREGTLTRSSVEIAERLDYYGAWLDLSSSLNHGFVTLYTLDKYVEQTLPLLADMLMNPTFPEKQLEVVRNINKQQFLVNSTRVEAISRRELKKALFGETHPYGVTAAAEDYDKVTPEVLRDFYQKYYHSGNCSVYVSGKITESLIQLVENTLGANDWGLIQPKAPFMVPPIHTTDEKRIFVERADALQGSLKMGGFMMDRKHPDYLPARVLVTLFGGYFGSRLMSNIREDKGYTYGIGAGIVNHPGYGELIIGTEADNAYVGNIIQEVYHEMERLQQELVGPEELEMVKNYMIGDLCRSYEGPFSLADVWIFIHTAELENDFIEKSVKAIQTITAEKVQSLAQTYFKPGELIEVIAGQETKR